MDKDRCPKCGKEYGKRRRCYSCEVKARWKPRPWMDGINGYYRIRLPGDKKVNYHRWLMEQHLGRKLGSKEIVHHINHDKTDNRIENLEVLSLFDHLSLHRNGTLKNKWAYRHSHCVNCGTTEIPHKAKGLCYRCYHRKWDRQNRSPRKRV